MKKHTQRLAGIAVALLLGEAAWSLAADGGTMPATEHKHTNRLAAEKSPYLLQHAHNPVDWYPWGEEAFEKARKEDKPIFLSVGYSTCHWCHVMERESFENEAIARILNKYFVCIKVDREERPDIDRVYMTYVQATTGGGGWPMNVWLTPDLKPFYGGTYFPPDDRWGRIGLPTVAERIATAWQEERDSIEASADQVTRQMQQFTTVKAASGGALDVSLLDSAARRIQSSYDPQFGGFGGAPKFPRPVTLNFLLRAYARTGDKETRERCLFTLRKMAEGGIHDQIGGGFHRYSVDTFWHVPHFEKMLYDQAQLVCAYLDAFQITHDPFYADVARDILEVVLRDMTGPDGGFYSAEDADSFRPGPSAERVEGAFYVWTRAEIEAVLGKETAALFDFHYGVEPEGNAPSDPQGEFKNRNILMVRHTPEETAKAFGKSPDEIRTLLAAARLKLRAVRDQRPRPRRDDKILAAWNGLMISAFARAAQVLDDPRYLAAAQRAAAWIETHLMDPQSGHLLRRAGGGQVPIDGFVDDYADVIQGLLDLYEASFDVKWLEQALVLQQQQDALFWDKENGGYFSTTGRDPNLLLRMKEDHDGAEPSPNSVAALNLLRLSRMTDTAEWRNQAERIFEVFGPTLARAPASMPQMLAALEVHLAAPVDIIIAGKADAEDTRALLREIHSRFLPNKVLVLADGGAGQDALAKHMEFIRGIGPVDGKAAAFVCENSACKRPASDVPTLAGILKALGPDALP